MAEYTVLDWIPAVTGMTGYKLGGSLEKANTVKEPLGPRQGNTGLILIFTGPVLV